MLTFIENQYFKTNIQNENFFLKNRGAISTGNNSPANTVSESKGSYINSNISNGEQCDTAKELELLRQQNEFLKREISMKDEIIELLKR